MWKRNNKDDYRVVMDHLNNDANYITMQLDTIATPRVSALDGGQETMSRNSFLEAKRASASRHGSGGPASNHYETPSSSRRSVGASLMNPMNLFSNTVMPKEIQLRTDAVAALSKVAQLLADKNTPPQLEMSLLDKGYQLIESLRTSRERINRKQIKKGSYLTLMSALDKKDMKGAAANSKRGNNNSTRGRSASMTSEALEAEATAMMGNHPPPNPWCRVIEQNYWWPHHIHSVTGRQEERAFESREPSPVPTTKSLYMEDPLKYQHQQPPQNNSYANNSNNNLSRSVSMPADGAGQVGYGDEMNTPRTPTNASPDGKPTQGKGEGNNSSNNLIPAGMHPSDSFSDLFLTQSGPTTAEVPALFYDESDLAMHALEMISDEEHKRGGGGGAGGANGVRQTGTKRRPAVVSEEYNQGLREHFIHAAHNPNHPMSSAIDAFLRYNASAILRISLPDALNVQPASDLQIEMWDYDIAGEGSGGATKPISATGGAVVGSVNTYHRSSRPQTPSEHSPTGNFLSVGGMKRGFGSGGTANNNTVAVAKKQQLLGASSPPSSSSSASAHHHDPLRGASLGQKINNNISHNDNASPSPDSSAYANDPNYIKCLWGIVPSTEYEKQFLRDRLQFIQALCETVLDRMFSDKHIPVVVTSTHVDGSNTTRSIDNMSPVRKSRGGRGGGGDGTNSEHGGGGGGAFQSLFSAERNSADGSVASSIRPSSSATYATGGSGGHGRRRTAIDLSFPFTEVLPEIIDSKLELLAVRSIFKWAEGFETNRRRTQSEDDAERERMRIGALTPNLIRDTSSRMLLEGAALKLSEFLKAIADGIIANELIFVDEMYDRFMDALMITYNIAETSRVKLAGTHAGADDVFPCIVYIIGTGRCAFLISALLRWTSTSTVACRLPPFLSKGVEAYVLQSFMAAANAVVGCIMREGQGYGY